MSGRLIFNKGARLTARALNALSRAAFRAFVAGEGVRIDQTPDQIVIHALADKREDIRYGRVKDVSVGSEGIGYPDEVAYTCVVDGIEGDVGPGVNENDGTGGAWKRVVNRPAYGSGLAKIKAQKIGSDVLVWFVKDPEGKPPRPVLIVLSEQPWAKVCGT